MFSQFVLPFFGGHRNLVNTYIINPARHDLVTVQIAYGPHGRVARGSAGAPLARLMLKSYRKLRLLASRLVRICTTGFHQCLFFGPRPSSLVSVVLVRLPSSVSVHCRRPSSVIIVISSTSRHCFGKSIFRLARREMFVLSCHFWLRSARLVRIVAFARPVSRISPVRLMCLTFCCNFPLFNRSRRPLVSSLS